MAEVSKIDIDGIEWDIRDDILTARFEQFLVQRELQRSYSTSEVDTGKKWIDGKTIYRRVVFTQQNTNINIASWNINTPIRVFGNATYVNAKITFPIFGNNREIYSWSLSNTSLSYSNVGFSYPWSNIYIVCEYTKNT